MTDVPTFINQQSAEFHASTWTDPDWPMFNLGVKPSRVVEAGRQRMAEGLRAMADLLEP